MQHCGYFSLNDIIRPNLCWKKLCSTKFNFFNLHSNIHMVII